MYFKKLGFLDFLVRLIRKFALKHIPHKGGKFKTLTFKIAQCARSLILREKWGVTSVIKSMHFWHLGTISSHSSAKLVSFDLLFIYY